MDVHAFLITTQPANSSRIATTRERLCRLGYDVTVVEGTKGAELKAGEYFEQTLFWRSQTGHVMTPGELGCTLSHQKALRRAANTPGAAHLILEDDFEASDQALDWIRGAGSHLPDRTLLHLGGQEGLERFYRYLRAVPSTHIPDAAQVDTADLRFLFRSVAYMVDSATAGSIASLIQDGAFVMDDFHHMRIRSAVDRVCFRWVVSHPLDLQTSEIEAERGLTRSSGQPSHWTHKSWLDLTKRRRMQWALAQRRLGTPPSRFLCHQQPRNQLPD